MNPFMETPLRMFRYTRFAPLVQKGPFRGRSVSGRTALAFVFGCLIVVAPLLANGGGEENSELSAALREANVLADRVAELHQKGRYDEALPLAQHVLDIRTQELGPADPEVANSASSLAALYYATGDYARAELYYERALKIREKAFGAAHPDVARTAGRRRSRQPRRRRE